MNVITSANGLFLKDLQKDLLRHEKERREEKCDQFRKKNIGQNVLTTKLWALASICK